MTRQMLLVSLGFWMIIATAAVFNGIAREAILIPQLGEPAGRAASALILMGIVLAVATLHRRSCGDLSAAQAWTVGVVWLALTLLFETGLGFSRGMSVEAIIAAYNPAAPTFWIYVVLSIFLAPTLARLLG